MISAGEKSCPPLSRPSAPSPCVVAVPRPATMSLIAPDLAGAKKYRGQLFLQSATKLAVPLRVHALTSSSSRLAAIVKPDESIFSKDGSTMVDCCANP